MARLCSKAKTAAYQAGYTLTSRAAISDRRCAICSARSHSRCGLPAGYSVSWSGQFEYLERATARLKIVVPATLAIIFLLLYLIFGRFSEATLVMATMPFALAGGVWLLWLLGHNISVASGVGFFALAGVSAEFGVDYVLYLKHAWKTAPRQDRAARRLTCSMQSERALCLRVRPKAMTVAVIIAGLVPIMAGSGTGSEVMQRIAAPMVGGMITVTVRLCW